MKYLVILLFPFVFIGCTNPMSEKITKSNYEEILAKVKDKGSLEDKKMVMAVVMMNSMAGVFTGQSPASLLEGKSFNEHIVALKERLEKEEAEAKVENDKKAKWLEEQKKAQAEEDKKIEDQTNMFEFSNYKKSNWETEYGIKKYVEIDIDVKNVSGKDIDAFEGWLHVSDKLDNELAKFYIKHTKLLKGGSSRKIETSRELSMFSDDRVSEVNRSEVSDLKMKIEIEKIVFK